ncbi:MAG: type II secretion system protein M [Sedimentisphaerales bacterium]|nr:type II secretion system protein M [Sedimentisphaerales bacterium]
MVRLNKRERSLAVGLVLTVAVWALYIGAVAPVRDRIRSLQRIIPEKHEELRTLQTQSAAYLGKRDAFESLRTRVAAQDPNFQLPSFLETLVEKQGLSKHVVTMTPNTLRLQADYAETIVGIELEAVSLRQLVDFLAVTEASEVVAAVGTLHIYRSTSAPDLLNATVEIRSPQPDNTMAAKGDAPR